ncbi:unnamed protein product [Effrenium voratum]|uniref:Uncharacterized protein n=1 Tax=Effrenium voratum TaxID=2562239 RepID=A0AA36MT98_9DINO|nr:unnamed protein product [Effrenium voratum]
MRRFPQSRLGTALISRCSSGEEVLVLVAQNLKSLDHIHCTASLHLLAKFSLKDGRLASRALGALLSRQADFLQQGRLDGRQMANTLWALARLRGVATGARPGLVAEVSTQLAACAMDEGLGHQDVSNGLWAMAVLDTHLPRQAELMGELSSARALTRPQGFNPQELANVIWALASCWSGQAGDLAKELAKFCVAERSRELAAAELAAVCWAVAVAALPASRVQSSLLEPLADVAQTKMDEFGPREVACLSWALAVDMPHPRQHPLTHALTKSAQQKAPQFTTQDDEQMKKQWDVSDKLVDEEGCQLLTLSGDDNNGTF